MPFFSFWPRLMLYDFSKRLLDVVGALFGLILFSPILITAALLIKLSSSGPVFVEQAGRVGKGETIFRMWKLRTMIRNSHELLRTDPKYRQLLESYKRNSFKLSNDPRVTTIGKILRRTSIDEIPQFLNVLFGEMSLVGPRAYYPDELAEQRKKFPSSATFIKETLQVRPGMTGLWQVSGRSKIGFERRIKMDAYYAKKKSLSLDLLILAQTPAAVIKGEGTTAK